MTTTPGCWPCLTYNDAHAALTYLAEVVGFEKLCAYEGDADRPIMHAEMLWPDGGGIMFGSPRPVGDPDRTEPGVGVTYLSTDAVVELADRVRSAGWTITRELTQTDYGSTDISFLDPEGNRWNVGTYRGEDPQAG